MAANRPIPVHHERHDRHPIDHPGGKKRLMVMPFLHCQAGCHPFRAELELLLSHHPLDDSAVNSKERPGGPRERVTTGF